MAIMGIAASAHAIEVSGTVSSDTVWAASLSPYTVTGDIVVDEGVTLKIEPGVTVEFANASSSSEGYHIEVNGALTARGSLGHPIVFTSADKTRYWEYIEFTETATAWDATANSGSGAGSILEYCVVEYAGNGSGSDHGQAAVRVIASSAMITRSIVRYSKSNGILCYQGVQEITSNRVHDTATGIMLLEPLAASVTNNYLMENTQGMAVDSATESLDISHNTVINASGEGYGSCLAICLMYHDRLAAYLWEQIGGTTVTLSDSEVVSPTFTVPTVSKNENLVFQLTVTSLDGLVSTDVVSLQAAWDNTKPVADAGDDQGVARSANVILDASDSFDADDGIDTCVWLQTSGPAVALTQSAATKQARFTAPAVDTVLIFQVTVTDTGGLKDSDTVVIRVKNSVVYAEPVAEAGAVKNVNEGVQVTLAGTIANDPSDHVNVVSWLWKRTAGDYVVLGNATSQNATFTVADVPAEGKSYTFELTVTDDQGQKSTDTVIVNILDTVAGFNTPPTADAQVSAATVAEGTTNVILDPSGSSDAGGAINSYSWVQISGTSVTLTNTSTANEKKFTAPNVTKNETLVFRLTVTDTGGLRAVDEVSVLVTCDNVIPVADAGDDQEADEGLRVLLDGSGSSDDQGITTYLWSQISGKPVTIFNSTEDKAYFTAPNVTANETLVFALLVNDGVNADQDIVHVEIIAADENPVADAGDDRVVAYGAAVTLDGRGSSDPEDPVTGITSYLWEQTAGPDVTLYNATSAQPNFTAPVSGDSDYESLTFQLTVTDGKDQKAMDSVVVNITSHAAGTPPTANAGPDRPVAVGTVVTLNGKGSIDPNAVPAVMVANNDFSSDDDTGESNVIAISREVDANADLTMADNNIRQAEGKYLVYLYDTAGTGGTLDLTQNWWNLTTADELAALIYDGVENTLLPLVTSAPFLTASVAGAGSDLSYPPMADVGDDLTVDPDEPVTLDGSGTYDPDHVLTYLWAQTGGKTVTLTDEDTATATFNAPSITDEDDEDAATLTFTLTVTDASGFSDSRELTVTVNTEEDDDKATYGSSGCFIGTML